MAGEIRLHTHTHIQTHAEGIVMIANDDDEAAANRSNSEGWKKRLHTKTKYLPKVTRRV